MKSFYLIFLITILFTCCKKKEYLKINSNQLIWKYNNSTIIFSNYVLDSSGKLSITIYGNKSEELQMKFNNTISGIYTVGDDYSFPVQVQLSTVDSARIVFNSGTVEIKFNNNEMELSVLAYTKNSNSIVVDNCVLKL